MLRIVYPVIICMEPDSERFKWLFDNNPGPGRPFSTGNPLSISILDKSLHLNELRQEKIEIEKKTFQIISDFAGVQQALLPSEHMSRG